MCVKIYAFEMGPAQTGEVNFIFQTPLPSFTAPDFLLYGCTSQRPQMARVPPPHTPLLFLGFLSSKNYQLCISFY